MARSTYNDFIINEKIGSGSFGVVYKVIRKIDRNYYAMKEIDLQGMSRREQEECIRETRVLSSLDSDFIIKYYDSFLERGKLYIITEYAANGNLHEYIKHRQGQRFPEGLIWKLFCQILLGLNHMHRKKILHRDIKTLNVFLDHNSNVKLGDMGVAKIMSTQTCFAKTIVGTPYYLSPELCEDKPYNEKSDVWAMGVVVYECCQLKHPFDANSQGALILKILRGQYQPVTGYSPELCELVKKCLTLNPSRRPSTSKLLLDPLVRQKVIELGMSMPDKAALAAQHKKTKSSEGAAAQLLPTRQDQFNAGDAPFPHVIPRQLSRPAQGPHAKNQGQIHVTGDMERPPTVALQSTLPSQAGPAAQAMNHSKAFVFGGNPEAKAQKPHLQGSSLSSTCRATSHARAPSNPQDPLHSDALGSPPQQDKQQQLQQQVLPPLEIQVSVSGVCSTSGELPAEVADDECTDEDGPKTPQVPPPPAAGLEANWKVATQRQLVTAGCQRQQQQQQPSASTAGEHLGATRRAAAPCSAGAPRRDSATPLNATLKAASVQPGALRPGSACRPASARRPSSAAVPAASARPPSSNVLCPVRKSMGMATLPSSARPSSATRRAPSHSTITPFTPRQASQNGGPAPNKSQPATATSHGGTTSPPHSTVLLPPSLPHTADHTSLPTPPAHALLGKSADSSSLATKNNTLAPATPSLGATAVAPQREQHPVHAPLLTHASQQQGQQQQGASSPADHGQQGCNLPARRYSTPALCAHLLGLSHQQLQGEGQMVSQDADQGQQLMEHVGGEAAHFGGSGAKAMEVHGLQGEGSPVWCNVAGQGGGSEVLKQQEAMEEADEEEEEDEGSSPGGDDDNQALNPYWNIRDPGDEEDPGGDEEDGSEGSMAEGDSAESQGEGESYNDEEGEEETCRLDDGGSWEDSVSPIDPCGGEEEGSRAEEYSDVDEGEKEEGEDGEDLYSDDGGSGFEEEEGEDEYDDDFEETDPEEARQSNGSSEQGPRSSRRARMHTFNGALTSSQRGRQVRMQHMRSAALIQRAACVDLIGEKAFLELYDLLSSHQVNESSMTELSRLVFKIISYDKSEVIQMLYKLLYMESQLESGDPAAVGGPG